jgi:pimeloyl-ACP methyl ester carboxylesterase
VRIPGPWTHREVSANGIQLHVVEIGDGPLALLLHGFPEFWWAWRHQLPALAAAGRRAVAVDLRGYGDSDKPPRGYDLWTLSGDVAGLVRALGERQADLVGHDWGGGHVVRLVAARPELVRSWVTDIAGCFDPQYVWHERAQVWQTPGAGEAAIQQQLATPQPQLIAFYKGLGMAQAAAERSAAAMNADMGRCILALYRSAAQPRMAEWGADLTPLRSRPGLVIIATEDHYTGGETLARRTAERAGAQVTVLEGLGHWWMCQDPRRGAAALRAFLETV